jgi:hypothetical protein
MKARLTFCATLICLFSAFAAAETAPSPPSVSAGLRRRGEITVQLDLVT